MYSYAEPLILLVPDLVTIETTAWPWPYSVVNELRRTLTSCTASSGGLSDRLLKRSDRT